MSNRRIDKLIMIVVFVLSIELIAILVHPSSNTSQTEKIFYILTAMLFSYGIFYCYIRVRNSIFCRKLNKYCNQKNCDTAINLLDRAIIGQPKIPWLRMQRAILLGTSGRYDSFWAEFNSIYNHEPFCKNNNIFYLSLIAISDGIDFLNDVSAKMKLTQKINEKPIEEYLKPPYLHIHNAIYAYQNNDMGSAVYYAGLLYDEGSDFFRLCSSFIFMNAYEALNQMEKSNIYKNIYQSNPLNLSALS